MGFILFTNVTDNIIGRETMDVLGRIKELKAERGWTNYQLAQEAAITQSTLTNMFSRKTLPSLTTLAAICDAFGITPSQFFADAGVDGFSEEEAELIRKYRLLSKKNKIAVKNLIDALGQI